MLAVQAHVEAGFLEVVCHKMELHDLAAGLGVINRQ